ncbi:MAG: N-6 DNA methylase, partial [Candidatus Latescibacterota bacterium]
MLKSYLKRIAEIAHQGDAREESYYSALETLLNEYAESAGRGNIHVTTLPKKTEAGNPDFRIWDGTQHIVGYMEAKAPTVEFLDPVETSEQLKRYLHTFPNVILTNFFEFRLYRNGSLTDKVLIGRSSIVHRLGGIPPVEKESDFFKLLDTFFSFSLPKVYSAKTLAVELAKRTRFLKDEVIAQELEAVDQTFLSDRGRTDSDRSDWPDHGEKQTGTSVLHGFYEAFRKYLIGGLSEAEFADLYAQTITYGLFAARTRSEGTFNRKLAYDNIPHTIGILRDVFKFVSLGDLPQQMEWVIDDISEVLAVTDVKNILRKYFHEGKGKDPIVHFYETFLAEYDPHTREKRGVYYTPEPVVSYMVRSLHQVLKQRFDKTDGFASTSVTVLDPAAGTLTFLAQAAQLAVEEFVSKYGKGGKEKIIKEHILENFYAFELMMAPYAVGHLKMSFLLEELGYKLQEEDRFKLYLTNTLEMEELAYIEIPGMASLSEESHLAGKVKKEQPVLVILGNPPYSGISTNKGDWITGLIENYKYVDGKHFGETKHWLQDDYVKFLRFAQWKIDEAGEGVLGFITNHSYLDNPTFRGMRQSLMNSFDEMYILDLHGNSLKKERCPDGSKDENVFDIRQGVAIAIFIKNRHKPVGQTFLSDQSDMETQNVPVGQTFLSDQSDMKTQNVPVGQTFLSDQSNIETENGPVGQTFLSDQSVESLSGEGDHKILPAQENELQTTRRHLPHWTLEGSTYYVTFKTARGLEGTPTLLLSIEEQKLVLEHIREGHGEFYTLAAAVVMPDHVHMILTPRDDYELSRIMKGIKGVSAKKVNLCRVAGTDKNVCPTGSLWQDESYDRIVRDEKEFREKLVYMSNNPVKAGLTDDPWSYHGWYCSEGFDREERQ